jgi:MoaA/NifB/PqqE/SkfB family radical SAM enzyme
MPMALLQRIVRHARLSARALSRRPGQTPPFMIVFINSVCNLTCEHCFYWRNLNRRDDLSYAEFETLSRELGAFENLNLSGGEPFLRPDFADITALFLKNNHVKEVYVPTSGYFTERTETQLCELLQIESLRHFVCELSLDGMPEYHNRLRGNQRSFQKAMETYDMLAELQKQDRRLSIHAVSTANQDNLDELRRLTEFLYDRCPAMDHHSLAFLRGDPKNPLLRGPSIERYTELYDHVARVWASREQGRQGSIVEPLLQWAKRRTVESKSQCIPCSAGRMVGVVYANGDVGVCEQHAPLGNLREQSFFEIWDSEDANALRARIRARECYCTNEVFLWPSIVFQPWELTKALIGAKFRRDKRPSTQTLVQLQSEFEKTCD